MVQAEDVDLSVDGSPSETTVSLKFATDNCCGRSTEEVQGSAGALTGIVVLESAPDDSRLRRQSNHSNAATSTTAVHRSIEEESRVQDLHMHQLSRTTLGGLAKQVIVTSILFEH